MCFSKNKEDHEVILQLCSDTMDQCGIDADNGDTCMTTQYNQGEVLSSH